MPAMGAIDGWNLAIVQLRKRAGLKQGEAAQKAGLSPAQLSRYESGSASPSLRTLGRLLDIYAADLAELGTEAKKQSTSGTRPTIIFMDNFDGGRDATGRRPGSAECVANALSKMKAWREVAAQSHDVDVVVFTTDGLIAAQTKRNADDPSSPQFWHHVFSEIGEKEDSKKN